MKNIFKIACALILLGGMSSCELFQAPNETENVQELLITFPEIILTGDGFVTLSVGDSFSDPGAAAALGVTDVSDQVVVTSNLDLTTPGIYSISYSISTTNELGSESTVSTSRFVSVIDPSVSADISSTDLSGSYIGSGFAANPVAATVTKIGEGWYSIDRILSSGNNIGAVFAHVGGDEIVMPSQAGPFGSQDTTSPGTDASITSTGFQWTVFISCCGNFGPIDFVKQ